MADVQKIKALVDEKADKFVGVANQVWSTPELGFKEEKSAAALIAALESEGFRGYHWSGWHSHRFCRCLGRAAIRQSDCWASLMLCPV